ncbi:uncharacterized protein L203_105241 [Cryptococcus depauperatus CBS 7841]|uniref:Uncharacterized protein n=1 Tax=Cryptococcus depauperatus CBS 7841 TaxID=1295531 RepID=A0A1E3HYC6_9TREE|nr:hypothetical protein L203_05608 [Cryptococcus depauperatus CBS 7841]ODN92228.1 hypothetical protein L204_05324 [Cryptococcus depauperatus CBS 7855]
MLISPAKLHSFLSSLISASPSLGPHTALLITPQGQPIVSASIPTDYGDSEEGDNEDDNNDEEEGDDAEEPYLDKPARLRLILGLASQWNENESPKMECELGRLYFASLPLPPLESPTPILLNYNLLPEVKLPKIDRFLLVLNSKGTEWDLLERKAEEFKTNWKTQVVSRHQPKNLET